MAPEEIDQVRSIHPRLAGGPRDVPLGPGHEPLQVARLELLEQRGARAPVGHVEGDGLEGRHSIDRA